MTEKTRYSYSILRYVHDVVTGEFLNVGVLLLTADHQLLSRTRKTIGRMRHVFPDLDREAFVESMRRFDQSVARQSKLLEKGGFLSKEAAITGVCNNILKADDSSLQWSAIAGGAAVDTTKALDAIFDRFVSRYDTASPARRSDEDVWRPVRENLRERGIQLDFETKTFVGTNDHIKFDRAWKNGKWHVYEPVSMDLSDADGIKDKARRWRGHLASVEDGFSEPIELHFLIGRPMNTSLQAAYRSALEILRGAPLAPKVYEDNDLPAFVDEIEDEYREHLREQQR